MANKSGYNAVLRVGSYAGASLTNVSVSINGETIDTTDLSCEWRTRARGVLDWEVSGTKNVDTLAFLPLMVSGNRAMPSYLVTVYDSNGVGSANRIFMGVALPTKVSVTYPAGAATEDITLVGMSAPTLP